MKIAFISAGMAQGGGQRVISVLANEFVRRGHQVAIICTGTYRGSIYTLDDRVQLHYLNDWIVENPDCSLLHRVKKRLLCPFKTENEFSRIKRDYQNSAYDLTRFFLAKPFDVALSFLVYDNMALAPCARKQKAKVIISEGTFPDRPEYSQAYKKARNTLYAYADVRVFQTEAQGTFFPQKLRKHSAVIGNPLSGDIPDPFSGQRQRVIVNFCRLDAPKNLKLLLEAFAMIVKESPDYRLEIYGDGPLHDEIQDYIISQGLERNAFLRPFDENIHLKIKNAAMFVTSSDYEGLSNSLMEAMALGMPVIATDCLGGGAAALIQNGKNGLLVPKGDVQELYQAMRQFVEDPELAAECGKNAINIREDFSIEAIADKWMALM